MAMTLDAGLLLIPDLSLESPVVQARLGRTFATGGRARTGEGRAGSDRARRVEAGIGRSPALAPGGPAVVEPVAR